MKIAVLNGSPKGQISVTMQYIHFLQQKFPATEFKIFDIALKIKKLEKRKKLFSGNYRGNIRCRCRPLGVPSLFFPRLFAI